MYFRVIVYLSGKKTPQLNNKCSNVSKTIAFQISIYCFYSLLEHELLYNVVLDSAVQQNESAICIHISLHLGPSSHPHPIHPGHHRAQYY